MRSAEQNEENLIPTAFVFLDKKIRCIEENPIRNFNSHCDWFVDNELSIHFLNPTLSSLPCNTLV